jgi:hypothetical protein
MGTFAKTAIVDYSVKFADQLPFPVSVYRKHTEVCRFLFSVCNKQMEIAFFCEDMETWRWKHEDIDMERWRHGDVDMQTCRHGDMDMQTWRHGYADMETWTCRHRPGDMEKRKM